MTAIQTIIIAFKGLVSFEQSALHQALSDASDQHEAEQKEMQQLRDDVAALTSSFAALSTPAAVDLDPLNSSVSALTADFSTMDRRVTALETEFNDLIVEEQADQAAAANENTELQTLVGAATLPAGSSTPTVVSGTGIDTIFGGAGSDTLASGAFVSGSSASPAAPASAANDGLPSQAATIIGAEGNDELGPSTSSAAAAPLV